MEQFAGDRAAGAAERQQRIRLDEDAFPILHRRKQRRCPGDRAAHADQIQRVDLSVGAGGVVAAVEQRQAGLIGAAAEIRPDDIEAIGAGSHQDVRRDRAARPQCDVVAGVAANAVRGAAGNVERVATAAAEEIPRNGRADEIDDVGAAFAADEAADVAAVQVDQIGGVAVCFVAVAVVAEHVPGDERKRIDVDDIGPDAAEDVRRVCRDRDRVGVGAAVDESQNRAWFLKQDRVVARAARDVAGHGTAQNADAVVVAVAGDACDRAQQHVDEVAAGAARDHAADRAACKRDGVGVGFAKHAVGHRAAQDHDRVSARARDDVVADRATGHDDDVGAAAA